MLPPRLLWTAAAAAALSALSASDVRQRRLPNELVLLTFALGATSWARFAGAGGLRQAALGALLGTALLGGPHWLGLVGAGDVKLAGALGSLLGPTTVLRALFAGVLLGGLMSAAHYASLARGWRRPPRRAPGVRPTIPLGAALCGGAACAVLGWA